LHKHKNIEKTDLEQQVKRCIPFRHLNPGGYLELQDVHFPSVCIEPNKTSDSKFVESSTYMIEAGQRIGLDFQAPSKWSELLEEAGFVDINFKWVNWPIGPWAKGDKYKFMGRLTIEDFLGAIDVTIPIFKALGWSTEKTQALINAASDELEEQNVLLYQRVCFCYARKPGSAYRVRSLGIFNHILNFVGSCLYNNDIELGLVICNTLSFTTNANIPDLHHIYACPFHSRRNRELVNYQAD
jgi:hypothetical protein